MSFTSDVKQEISLKTYTKDDLRAELSALIQLTSSLSISNRGLALICTTENAAVSRAIYRICRERYNVEIMPSVKRRMNLNKNLIYRLRLEGNVKEILEDLGIYSSRGLLEKPLQRIVAKESCARAYLTGAFMAEGSVNSPNTTNYHLEIKAGGEEHADFLIELLNRLMITAKKTDRRGHWIVYIKSAEKISLFLQYIGADQCLLEFEDARISRDFNSSVTRLNNVDVANVVKSMEAAAKQMEDIRILQENDQIDKLDEKLRDIIDLRLNNPEGSLNELAADYKAKTGNIVSKSGLKHRFVKLHDLADKWRNENE